MNHPPSWSDLETGAKAEPVSSRFDEVCALVFSAGAGRELLAELRRKHFDSPFNPHLAEPMLRVRAAQQQFVRDLEMAAERGFAAMSKQKTA